MTHLGGTRASVAAVLLPAVAGHLHGGTLGREIGHASLTAAAVLVLSQIVVHLAKRTICRARPQPEHQGCVLVAVPDHFSFPSGHSAAATATAVTYAAAFPLLAVPLLLLAAGVCASRVRLGVHYPGDVIAGQLIAVCTAALVLGMTGT